MKTAHDLVAAVARNRLKQALPAVLLLGLSACAGTSTGVVTRYPGGSVSEPSATASTSSAATTRMTMPATKGVTRSGRRATS